MIDYLLPVLTFSTIFERFNIFLTPLDFSLKLSLILFPLVGLILLVRKKLTFNPTFLFPFLAAIFLVEGLSIPFSFDRFQSFQVVTFHLLMFGLFYLIVWAIREVKDLEKVVLGWGAGALTVSLYGFWQFWRYLQGQSPAIFLEKFLGAKSLPADTFIHQVFGRTLLRPSSTFIDTTTASSFVTIAILLSLGFLLATRSRRQRLFLVAVLTVSLVFFAMSSSRSAILGLGVGLLVFTGANLLGRINKRLFIIVATISLLVLLATVGWLSTAKIRTVSNILRIEYTQGAFQMFQRNPLLGIGVGNFEACYTEVLRPTQAHGYSHSIFLTWLGETGILGLLVNLGLVGAVILFLGRESLKYQFGTPWRLRLTSLLSAFAALVVTNLFHAHYGLEFTWVLLGLAVSGYYLARESVASRQGRASPKAGSQEPVDVLGIGVDNVTMEEAGTGVKKLFRGGKKGYVVTPNPEMVVAARSDREFAQILNDADLAVADGIGLVWASRILGTPLKGRVSGTDLFLELCAEAARRGGQIFLLEGPEGLQSSKTAAQVLRQRYPKLNIVGTFIGDGSPKGDKETIRAIEEASKGEEIDLLFAAYGHGKQERWIKRNLKKIPVKVAMGVGGAFDFVAGEIPRAPKLIQQLGLEWLFRLVKQPWRIRRQILLLPFIALVFKEALFR